MNIVLLQKTNNALCFNISNLPPIEFHDWDSVSSQIVQYFQTLLMKQSASRIQIPSVMTLAGYFNCCETDILDALNILRLQSYECSSPSLRQPITLEDPLCTAA